MSYRETNEQQFILYIKIRDCVTIDYYQIGDTYNKNIIILFFYVLPYVLIYQYYICFVLWTIMNILEL